MNRPHPARDKAAVFLSSLLERCDTTTLPPLRELARLCGVSPATVWKEITSLQSQKRLVTRWGHEIRVNEKKAAPPRATEVPRQAKWQRIRETIANEFLTGRYPPGSVLPAKKELQRQYKASYQTITKVLSTLSSAGEIEIILGGFRIPVSRSRRKWRPKIVVICAGSQLGIPKIVTERERMFYQFLTIEATHAQVDLDYIIYEDWGDEPVFYPPHNHPQMRPPDDDSVLGYIVSSWHMKSFQDCLSRLSHIHKPQAVWLENSLTGDVINTGRLRAFFNIGYSSSPGQHMGEHLIKQGHREIAYLSPFHKSLWSQERLYGLIDVYGKQGASFKVHPFTSSFAESEWDFTEEVQRREDLDAILQTDRITNELPSYLKERAEQFRNEGIKLLRDSLIMRDIEVHLLRILNTHQITAIVGANDLCALLSLDYLKGNGIGVPSQVSLAGFDDSFEGLVNGLTSYSFNTHSLVRAMINYTAGSQLLRSKTEVRFFEGMVIERSTT